MLIAKELILSPPESAKKPWSDISLHQWISYGRSQSISNEEKQLMAYVSRVTRPQGQRCWGLEKSSQTCPWNMESSQHLKVFSQVDTNMFQVLPVVPKLTLGSLEWISGHSEGIRLLLSWLFAFYLSREPAWNHLQSPGGVEETPPRDFLFLCSPTSSGWH